MFKVQMLRALVNERLSSAVEEIFVVLERTIADYEDELCRTKEENHRQRQLLDALCKAHADAPSAAAPPPLHVEEDAGERPDDPEEVDLGELAVTRVIVKSEDEGECEEKAASDGAVDAQRREQTQGGNSKRRARGRAAASALGGESVPRGERLPRAEEEKQFSCSACDMTFKFHSTFLGHMKRHSGDKSYTCTVCNAAFRFQSTFVNHVRTHTGEKPFACQMCNATFGAHSSLLRHVRSHTGEKRFTCSFCEKKFPRKSSLVEHVRIHTGEKPLSCSVCDMTFRFHSKLVKHMRTHKGDKALTCHACGQNFISKLRLDKHACARGESSGARTDFTPQI
ncbi:zinc finger protein 879-like isoform X2 [Phyllopteryx taeniolatus]|uniref:zinc finger protein 879-like isoform X2 n=1 Tax=Phyllopteryx taeniolatus TaxID=161469 RepID=UPI002AD4FD05|nr:zinc finger protein 879-like isoform X2 [Phyllopteryx taeniolatus]